MTLSDGTTTVTLPAGLTWSDEHQWISVKTASERALDGTLIIDAAPAIGGRPVTLSGPVWITRTELVALRDLMSNYTSAVGLTLTLNNSSTLSVFPTGPPDARDLISYEAPEASDLVELLTMPLMEA